MRGRGLEVEFDPCTIGERVRARPDWGAVLAAVGRIPGVERLFFAYFPGYRPLLPTAGELWSFLSGVEGIKDVALCEVQIESFEGMPVLAGLNRLGLMSTGISTFAGMPDLPALTHLDLNSTKVRAFAGMPDMPTLTHLDIGYTGIAAFAGFRTCPPWRAWVSRAPRSKPSKGCRRCRR
jgi:hypothetical protein